MTQSRINVDAEEPLLLTSHQEREFSSLHRRVICVDRNRILFPTRILFYRCLLFWVIHLRPPALILIDTVVWKFVSVQKDAASYNRNHKFFSSVVAVILSLIPTALFRLLATALHQVFYLLLATALRQALSHLLNNKSRNHPALSVGQKVIQFQILSQWWVPHYLHFWDTPKIQHVATLNNLD
jgi:hypothetical protein